MKKLTLPYGKIIIGIENLSLSNEDKKRLIHPSVGGVILFARNFESLQQLQNLTNEIKSIRQPILPIMVDQEGGRVQRFNHSGFTKLPSLYDIAQHGDIELLKAHATILSYELRTSGVDLSLTPSVDLYNPESKVINNRAFSNSPQKVVNYAKTYIQSLKKVGLSAVIKHFPGHGSIVNDTHTELAINQSNYDELLQTDLYPFQALINSDVNISAIMASHVLYNQVDRNIPTFSKHWLKDILRSQLKFKGLILSDDMGMFAANSQFNSTEDAISKYFECGGDLTLLCNNFDVIDQILLSEKNYVLEENKQILINNLCVNTQSPSWLDKIKPKYLESKQSLANKNLI